MKPITQFLSFGTLEHGHKMFMAHERWTKQIEHLKSVGLVENGKIYSENDLDENWQNRFGKYISRRGYSYYAWKPYILNNLFEGMQQGDSLCYFDGGCVFPEDKPKVETLAMELQKRIALMQEKGYDVGMTRALKSRGRNIPCGYITRKEITDKFGLSDNKEFLYDFPHWQSGLISVVKTPKTEKLMRDWIQFYLDNFETCIDFPYPSKKNQIKGFVHNGSDQAVLQCLLYKGEFKVLNLNKLLQSYIRRKRC